MEFFSADWHLGHDAIRLHCNRPFSSVEEMDRTIIDRCNNIVKPDDTLFIIGDITFRASNSLDHYRSLISCKNIYLVFGNHDPCQKRGRYKITSPDKGIEKLFVKVDKAMTISIRIDGQVQHIYLHHYACRTWDKSIHGSWHLYGHSHGKLPDDPHALSMDVGVDAHNFQPLSLTQVSEFMANKRDALNVQQQREGKLQ